MATGERSITITWQCVYEHLLCALSGLSTIGIVHGFEQVSWVQFIYSAPPSRPLCIGEIAGWSQCHRTRVLGMCLSRHLEPVLSMHHDYLCSLLARPFCSFVLGTIKKQFCFVHVTWSDFCFFVRGQVIA